MRLKAGLLVLFGSLIAACSSDTGIPSETPGNEVIWVGLEGELFSEFIIVAEDDFVISYTANPDIEVEDDPERAFEYNVVYSRLFFTTCEDDYFEITQRERLLLAELLAGERKIARVSDGDQVYRDKGVQQVELGGERRDVRVIERRESGSYYLDPENQSFLGSNSTIESESNLWALSDVKKAKPLNPEIIKYAKENCVPEPLANN